MTLLFRALGTHRNVPAALVSCCVSLLLAAPAHAQPIPAFGAPLPPRLGAWEFKYSQFTDSTTAEGPADNRTGRYVQLQARERGRARTDSLEVRLYWEDKSAVLNRAFLGQAAAAAQAAAATTRGAEGAPFRVASPVYFVIDTARVTVPVSEVVYEMRVGVPVYRGWAVLSPDVLRRLSAARDAQVQAWDDKLGRFPFTAAMRAAAVVALQIVDRPALPSSP